MKNHAENGALEQTKSKQAWLLYWEYAGVDSGAPHKLCAIINYRYSADTVCRIVETIHAGRSCTASEQLIFAKHPKRSPLRARRDGIQGVAIDRIFCGHNLRVVAERAYDLSAVMSYDRTESLKFKTRRINVELNEALSPTIEWEWVDRELTLAAEPAPIFSLAKETHEE